MHISQSVNKLTWVAGHFAERHFAERHFAKRTLCRRTICRKDFLPNGHFDERTLRRKDILPKGQLAENREIFWVRLERFAYTVNVCFIAVNFRVVAKFILIHKQVCKQSP